MLSIFQTEGHTNMRPPFPTPMPESHLRACCCLLKINPGGFCIRLFRND